MIMVEKTVKTSKYQTFFKLLSSAIPALGVPLASHLLACSDAYKAQATSKDTV